VIEHQYRPSVGETAGTMVGVRPAGRNPLLLMSEYEKKYCMDRSFLAAV
jgi:hypothetical protein